MTGSGSVGRHGKAMALGSISTPMTSNLTTSGNFESTIGAPSAAMASADMQAGGAHRRRHKTRSKWHFGVRSKSPPLEVMQEIYRALLNLGMDWKSFDPYHVRCRYKYPDGSEVKIDVQLYQMSSSTYLVDFKAIPTSLPVKCTAAPETSLPPCAMEDALEKCIYELKTVPLNVSSEKLALFNVPSQDAPGSFSGTGEDALKPLKEETRASKGQEKSTVPQIADKITGELANSQGAIALGHSTPSSPEATRSNVPSVPSVPGARSSAVPAVPTLPATLILEVPSPASVIPLGSPTLDASRLVSDADVVTSIFPFLDVACKLITELAITK